MTRHPTHYSLIIFFNSPATSATYTVGNTLSLHDALPISARDWKAVVTAPRSSPGAPASFTARCRRSEEHTSELQSLPTISYAVFCLKKKKTQKTQQKPHSSQYTT